MSGRSSAPLPVRRLAAPTFGVTLLAGLLVAAVGFDQGALAAPVSDALRDSGGVLHELFHDARHLLGFPCH